MDDCRCADCGCCKNDHRGWRHEWKPKTEGDDMPKFRKKPVEIDAIQFTGSNVNEIWDAFGAAGIYGPTEKNPDHLILTTVHGDEAPARAGDWIIPDGKPHTFYPCKPDIFAATYEEVL